MDDFTLLINADTHTTPSAAAAAATAEAPTATHVPFPRYNTTHLRQLFASYRCQPGDVLFDWRANDSAVCWSDQIANRLGIAVPAPTNISNLYPIEYAQPLFGYVMPLLFVITIVSNTLIIIVMSRKSMRTPTNMVLMSMAVADMLTLLVPAPWMFYLYTLSNYHRPLDSVAACYLFTLMTDTLPSLFHTSSIWLTLVLAGQRYIYVCHAPHARVWCTPARVIRTMVGVYVMALLHQLPRLFDRSYDTLQIYNGVTSNETTGHLVSPDSVYTTCSIGRADWVGQVVGENVYYGSYFCFRVVFVHLLPCILLVILNILLFRTLQRAQAKRQLLFSKSAIQNRRDCGRAMDSSCTTLMLIFVVSVFLIVEIPLAVVTTLHIAQNLIASGQLMNYEVSQAVIVIINSLIMISYPINFAIYCGMSRQFRDTFADLFIGQLRRTTALTGTTRCHTTNGPKREETAL